MYGERSQKCVYHGLVTEAEFVPWGTSENLQMHSGLSLQREGLLLPLRSKGQI